MLRPPRSGQAAAASSLPDTRLPYGRAAFSRLAPDTALRRRHTCALCAPSLPETLAGARVYLLGFEELFLFINILLICNVIYNLLWTHQLFCISIRNFKSWKKAHIFSPKQRKREQG